MMNKIVESIIRASDDSYFQAWIVLLFGIWFLYIGTGYYWIGLTGSHLSFLLSGVYFGKFLKGRKNEVKK